MEEDPSISPPADDLTSKRENAPVLEARQSIATRTTSTQQLDHGIMAAPTTQVTNRTSEYGSDIDIQSIATLSYYGSDIDIDDVTILADAFDPVRDAAQTEKSAVLPSIEFQEGELEDEEQDVDGFVQIHRPTVLRIAKGKGYVDAHVQRDAQSSPMRERKAMEVEYDERSRQAWSGTLAQVHSMGHLHQLTSNSA
jgi:exonuclease V